MTDRRTQLQTFAFIGGEVAPDLNHRVDLEKYGLSASKISNFIPDFKGGIKSRPGFIYNNVGAAVSKSFVFRTGLEQSDIRVIFTPGKIYFNQDGQYLLDIGFSVTGIAANVLTIGAHSFAAGDLVTVLATSLPNDTYRISAVSATTITVLLENGATPQNSMPYVSGGAVWSHLSLDTPYTSSQVRGLNYDFRLDHAEVLHPDHVSYTLQFSSGAFSFAPTQFDTVIQAPTNLSATFSDVGDASTLFVVSAVTDKGEESLPSVPLVTTLMFNFTLLEGYATVTWDAVPGAAFYRVYRSVVLEDVVIDRGRDVGLVGETRGTSFTDNNILPDFANQPRISQSPFSPNSVLTLTLTSPGFGYDPNAGLSISSAGGTGFIGYPIVVNSEVVGARVVQGGQGYQLGDVVTITNAGGGVGAAFAIGDLSPSTGLNPSCTSVYEQRRYYSGIDATPLTVIATRSGTESDFSFSNPLTADDSYTRVIDSDEAVPIFSMLPLKDSLLLFHSRGVHRLYGSEDQGATALLARARLQSSLGSNAIPPKLINDSILYVSFRGRSIYSVAYDLSRQSFVPVDRTLLASHLFRNFAPKRIEWINEPHKLLWVLREDGSLFSMTFLPEQEIYAWARHETQGRVKDIVAVRDQEDEYLYITVERLINGKFVYYNERLANREILTAEEYVGVDSALQTTGTPLNTTITIVESGTDATLTFGTPTNLTSNVGDVIRAQGGIYEITAVPSASEVTCLVIQPATKLEHVTSRILVAEAFDGELWTNSTTWSGFGHLEGATISVMADGDSYLNMLVTNGTITFPVPVSRVVGGLAYTCELNTLPIQSAQAETVGRRMRTPILIVNLHESRGLQYGELGGRLWDFQGADYEDLGDVIASKSGQYELHAQIELSFDNVAVLRTVEPLPLTILGFTGLGEFDDAI